MNITVNFQGQTHKSDPETLIKRFEGMAYQAERENKSPHEYRQMAEYIKRGDYRK